MHAYGFNHLLYLMKAHSLKTIALILIAGSFLLHGAAHAMDSTPRPCSGWNTARKANLSTVVQREWVYGYLTGMSDALKALNSEDVFGLLPANEDVVARLNAFCEKQPESTVNQGVQALFNQIRQRP
jgi:hypothetical protein